MEELKENKMKCIICNKEFKKKEKATIRQAWIDDGGFGHVLENAIVHVHCDNNERKLKHKDSKWKN